MDKLKFIVKNIEILPFNPDLDELYSLDMTYSRQKCDDPELLKEFEVEWKLGNHTYSLYKIIGDKIYRFYYDNHSQVSNLTWIKNDNKIVELEKLYHSSIEEIQKTPINKIISMKDLFITSVFKDYSRPHIHFDKINKCFNINIMEDGPNFGSAGGPSMITVCTIAKLFIIDTEDRVPLDLCVHCKRFTYGDSDE